MGLRLRELHLDVKTSEGLFGARISFQDGLNIIRADNTSGKSTCVQAIVYVLGLEAMLGTSNVIPLPHAMTHSLEYQGRDVPVVESWVTLELENTRHEVLTVMRSVKSQNRDPRLVSAWRGKPIESAGYLKSVLAPGSVDYFVHMEGAAQRKDGFHYFLNEFIGWSPPTVGRYDDSRVPLYAECIFPLAIVEQKHGWSGIQARIPTHFKIREASKRAIEFVLALDVQANIAKREQARAEVLKLKSAWGAAMGDMKGYVAAQGGVLQNVLDSPPSAYSVENRPDVMVPRRERWLSPTDGLRVDKENLTSLVEEQIPSVEQASRQITQSLQTAESQLKNSEAIAARFLEDVEAEEAQLAGLGERISALREDLQHNKDALRLRNLGSEVEWKVSTGICPTCQQAIDDSLLEQASHVHPMPLEENISYVEGQISLFGVMEVNARRTLDAKRRQLDSMRGYIDSLRSEIRSYKRTLVSDDRLPAESAIQGRLVLEDRINKTEELVGKIELTHKLLSALTEDYNSALRRLKSLQGEELSVRDREALSALEKSFIEQIRIYGFRSVRPESIVISLDTYRPSHEGFDLGFDLSASDMIRTIWAYLNGLMEVARNRPNNHPGFMILDEPRQQDAAKLSFKELLVRTSLSFSYGQQVIFATSEEEESLVEMLSGVPSHLVSFAGKILMPIRDE